MRLFRSEKEKQPSEVRPDKESTFLIWSGVVVGLLGVGSNSIGEVVACAAVICAI